MKKVLVLKGQSAYNVLRYAADKICEGFRNCGYETEVIDTEQEDADRRILECLAKREEYEFYFSMQALLWNLEKSQLPQLQELKRVGWIVDAPVYHSARLLLSTGKDAHVLTIQHSHADTIRREYPYFERVETLYHGGFTGGMEPEYDKKDIDVFFSGTYVPVEDAEKAVDEIEGIFGKLAQAVKQRLKAANMADTWTNELNKLLAELQFEMSETEYQAMIEVLYPLDQYQRSYMRKRMVECIVEKKITLSVVGSGWENYNGAGKEYLQILSNEGVDITEVVKLMQHSKIVLNNINFLDGMHERIFTAMLAKAVCLTNEHDLLKSLFEVGEEVVTYPADKPEMLPVILQELLENREKAEKIANAAYHKAIEKHTWEKRGEQIIKWMEDGQEFVY